MSGVQDSKVIDLVTTREAENAVVLIMVETRSWGDEGELLLQLQEKFHTYLDFIEQGELVRKFPAAKGKQIVVRLDTKEAPGDLEMNFLRAANSEWLSPLSITLEWGLLEPGPDGQPRANQVI